LAGYVGHSEVIPTAHHNLAVRISQLLDCARSRKLQALVTLATDSGRITAKPEVE
jgi:hypothetical protein